MLTRLSFCLEDSFFKFVYSTYLGLLCIFSSFSSSFIFVFIILDILLSGIIEKSLMESTGLLDDLDFLSDQA